MMGGEVGSDGIAAMDYWLLWTIMEYLVDRMSRAGKITKCSTQ